MKRMNKRNSERVLAYIKKARTIIDQESESREDELFLSDVSIAEDCLSSLSEIMVTINNTTMQLLPRPCRVMQGESEKDMEITVNEFLGMAFDNTFEFVVYDFTTNKNIFDSTVDEELSDDIGEIYV